MNASAKSWLVIMVAFLMQLSETQPAFAQFKTLYTFCKDQQTCPDGSSPSSVILGPNGILYGTTFGGGAYDGGTVFELVPDAQKKRWTHKILHDFCKNVSHCADGVHPMGPVILDISGNLYGTTYTGGAKSNSSGVVFELVPDPQGKRWTEKTLYDFCSKSFCKDGSTPETGLSYPGAASGAYYDGTSPLFGTTVVGGGGGQTQSEGAGVVYELTPPVSGRKTWQETPIYRFCLDRVCEDGQFPSPYGQLAFDGQGNIFGTTRYGAWTSQPNGVAFEVSHVGETWSETILHSFCSEVNCADGFQPYGNMTFDSSGALIGTTSTGATNSYGTLFKIIPNGTASEFSVLYNFCSLTDCTDGSIPMSNILIDAQGDIFGTTTQGGVRFDNNSGTLFEFNQPLLVLHKFCKDSQHNCPDGTNPAGALAMDSSGTIFGTTRPGRFGAGAGGTVFAFHR